MTWFRFVFNRNRREQEFDRELEFHIDELAQNLIAQGIAPGEARRRAMLEFGGKEQTAQSLRDVHVVVPAP